MRTHWSCPYLRNLCALCLCLSVCSTVAHAAGTGYNMTYVGGVKTVTLPPETATFKDGLNVVLVTNECASCHSSDYPTTQPYQDRAGWLAVVDKMKDNFGMMPLGNTDEALIIDYLTTYYGR
jgi:sulfite dehydrogenase (cytochrome) subunit B